ncbi:DUF3144 domain-containing protein [Endozoicomonas sp.]|uniref:DUF3144 domain-containing protein n=1 Tax=Endozoicomonas sp. TaxID=1892382 RepID=UPI00383BF31C
MVTKTTPEEEEDKQNQKDIFDLANKFIALANNMSQKDKKEFWKIGTAFRYAAARYSSHESAVGSQDLLKDRDELENWMASQFKTMLIENMQQQIAALKSKDQTDETLQ